MKEIIIVGAGGLGKEVIDLIRDIGKYEIVGIVDDNPEKKGILINNAPVIGTINDINKFNKVSNLVLAVANPGLKRFFFEKLKKEGFHFPNLIHPTVQLGSSVHLGVGNILGAYSVISTETEIGDFVTINPQCGIGHESVIESFSTLYWNVHLGGNTRIASGCELGTSSFVKQGIQIGKNVILGAGAVVVDNLNEAGTYVGIPARKVN